MIPNTRSHRGLAYSALNRRRSASVRRATRQPLTLPGEVPANRTIARVAVCVLLAIAALSGAVVAWFKL